MRLAAWLGFFVMAAAYTLGRAQAQTPEDEELRVYAVNVVKQVPFDKEFTGYGIYLGSGKVITAAHVVGNWPLVTHPRVLVAGLDLSATIIKQGSLDDTDLALLSVDEEQLPVSLRLRRNPLCKQPPLVGTSVIVVYPEKTSRSRVISPLAIAPQYRAKYGSLIAEAEGSGSGVFHADRRCLLGIISVKVRKYSYREQSGHIFPSEAGYAGYYVGPAAIANFISPDIPY